MADLNNIEKIKALDKSQMSSSINLLGDQLESSWQGANSLHLPSEYRQVQNIVVVAMGGSALGADFLRFCFDVAVPVQIVRDYNVPSFVGEKSLVIASSYSGNTEETLSALEQAIGKKSKVITISTGGKLVEFSEQKNIPVYRFEPKFNPCGQPRMATGYSIGSLLGIFSQLGLVEITDKDIETGKKAIADANSMFNEVSRSEKNLAKKAALDLQGKIPIVVGAEFLAGNAHIFANQLNENAKVFSAYFLLPELNHHLLEGLRNPANLAQIVHFVFLESNLYSARIRARVEITKNVLKNNNIAFTQLGLDDESSIESCFKALSFSSWASFYLAIAYDLDPSPIPNVDYFKEALSKLV